MRSNFLITYVNREWVGALAEKGSISIQFAAAALTGALARGMQAAPILRKAGIDPALLSRPDARVPVQAYGSLLRLLAQLLDDEFFGLDSRRMKVGSFALSCLLALSGEDLGRALTLLCRSYNATLDDLRVGLVRDGRRAALEVVPTRPDQPLSPFAAETLFVYIHGIACWLARRRIVIDEAEFPYPQPARAGEYFVLFSTQLRFDRPVCRLWFDADALSLPVAQDARTAQAFLNQAPESFLVKYRNPDGFGRRVANLLRRRAPADWPGADAAATTLRCSPATLRRMLRQEGTSFQAIKDRLRLEMAREALARPDLSIANITVLLGFAEPAAFNRAFRQWTGTTPARYRRDQIST